MLTITEAAADRLQAAIAAKQETNLAVRLTITGRGKEGFRYDFRMVFQTDQRPDDIVVSTGKFDVFIDPETAPHLDGAVLDLKEDASGFRIDNPNPVWTDPKGPLILDVIENKINPGVAMHGGQVTLVDVRDQYGLVVTNWHVVRDSQGIVEVVFPHGFRSHARPLKVDSNWDLAALVIWRPQIEPVRITSQPPRPGVQATASASRASWRSARSSIPRTRCACLARARSIIATSSASGAARCWRSCATFPSTASRRSCAN